MRVKDKGANCQGVNTGKLAFIAAECGCPIASVEPIESGKMAFQPLANQGLGTHTQLQWLQAFVPAFLLNQQAIGAHFRNMRSQRIFAEQLLMRKELDQCSSGEGRGCLVVLSLKMQSDDCLCYQPLLHACNIAHDPGRDVMYGKQLFCDIAQDRKECGLAAE